MDAYTIVRNAILNKDSISGQYHGFARKLSPHVIGTNKRGQRQALFYQYGGGSVTGLGPPGSIKNWRCIPIDDMSDVSTISGEWNTADEHGVRQQVCVRDVDVKVAY